MVAFQEIATKYLWGSNDVPADKASPTHIRPAGVGSSASTSIQEYMQSGPGRFATMEKFLIVELFFSGFDIPAGEYLELELRSLLNTMLMGLTQINATISLSQLFYRDSTDDYVERV
jgi:hypothetical protein